MAKDLIDRQQLLAEMHMAADGNYHDIYRNIEGEKREYPALTFDLAVSMVNDMPGIDPDMIAADTLAKAEDKITELFQARVKDHQAISYADICQVFEKLREGLK